MTSGDRILLSMSRHRFSFLDAGEIAHAAGVSESTARRWIPRLLADHYLQYTHYKGMWALSGNGRRRAAELG